MSMHRRKPLPLIVSQKEAQKMQYILHLVLSVNSREFCLPVRHSKDTEVVNISENQSNVKYYSSDFTNTSYIVSKGGEK